MLRVATYNLHSGLGPYPALRKRRVDVEANLRAIAATLATAVPGRPLDIIALNEVDFAARRSGGFDQAEFIALELYRLTGEAYRVVAGQTWQRKIPGLEVRFGNAALVRHRIEKSSSCLFDDTAACGVSDAQASLPSLRGRGLLNRMLREARGVVTLEMAFNGRPVDIVVTHLDAFAMAEREAQAAHILHRFVNPERTTVVLGDLNAVPTVMTRTRGFFAADRTHDILTSGTLADARVMFAAEQGKDTLAEWATFPAEAPIWPLDVVLGSLDLVPKVVRVIGDKHSDHRGLLVEFQVSEQEVEQSRMRAQHDRIRARQLAQILECDFGNSVTAQLAKARWLVQGTRFGDIFTREQKTLLTVIPAM